MSRFIFRSFGESWCTIIDQSQTFNPMGEQQAFRLYTQREGDIYVCVCVYISMVHLRKFDFLGSRS